MSLICRSYLSPVQDRFFQDVWAWLGASSGIGLGVGSEAGRSSEEPDVLFMCGLPTGREIDRFQPLVAAVLAGARYGGRPVYFTDLVVREGRPGPPLPGWRIAYNQTTSFSGWVAPRWGLEELGLDPDSFTWIPTGSHLRSLEAVRSGEADAAGIDSMVLDLVTADETPGAGLATVESFGPWPAPPISTSAAMDRSLRGKLAAILSSMHEQPAGADLLNAWGVERLAPADPSEYARLARLAGPAPVDD